MAKISKNRLIQKCFLNCKFLTISYCLLKEEAWLKNIFFVNNRTIWWHFSHCKLGSIPVCKYIHITASQLRNVTCLFLYYTWQHFFYHNSKDRHWCGSFLDRCVCMYHLVPENKIDVTINSWTVCISFGLFSWFLCQLDM